jgi:hypothetical protein
VKHLLGICGLTFASGITVGQHVPKAAQGIPESDWVEVPVPPPPLIPKDQPIQSAAAGEPTLARKPNKMATINNRMKAPAELPLPIPKTWSIAELVARGLLRFQQF